jgi:hypothetical protein
MSQFRTSKRAKELKRKERFKAKQDRKRERDKNAATRSPDDDIDWSQAVGFPPAGPATAEPGEQDPAVGGPMTSSRADTDLGESARPEHEPTET